MFLLIHFIQENSLVFQGFQGWPAANSNAQYMPLTSQSCMTPSNGQGVPSFMQFSQHIPPLNNLSTTQQMIHMSQNAAAVSQCMPDSGSGLGGKLKVCYDFLSFLGLT